MDLHPSGRPDVIGDVTQLPFRTDSFDVATSFEVLEHLREQTRYLDEVGRVLRPDGVLLLSTPNGAVERLHNRVTGTFNPYHIALRSTGELTALLRRHFKEVQIFGQADSKGLLGDAARAADVFRLHLRLRVGWKPPIPAPEDVHDSEPFQSGPAAEQRWSFLTRLGAPTSPALFAVCRWPRPHIDARARRPAIGPVSRALAGTRDSAR